VSGAVLLALLLSFLAGISTTIGAVVAFFIKKTYAQNFELDPRIFRGCNDQCIIR
jgi:zinc transporter ZupT